jgi:hypothetical protein
MVESIRAVRRGALGVFLLAAVPLACDGLAGSDGGGGDGGEGGGEGAMPSEQDTSECKGACNQLKFFDCNDAADHARCFEACEVAPPSGIEVFVACVQADICDPECAAGLEGTVPSAEGGGEVEGGGGEVEGGGGEEEGGGSTEPTCTDACGEFIAAGCVPPVDCAGLCGTLSAFEQSFVVYCVERRDGCTLPEECAEALPEVDGGVEVEGGGGGEGGTDPIEQCQGACDDMEFFSCIDEAQHADCRALCTTAPAADIDTFVACASGCTDDACYQVFAP